MCLNVTYVNWFNQVFSHRFYNVKLCYFHEVSQCFNGDVLTITSVWHVSFLSNMVVHMTNINYCTCQVTFEGFKALQSN